MFGFEGKKITTGLLWTHCENKRIRMGPMQRETSGAKEKRPKDTNTKGHRTA